MAHIRANGCPNRRAHKRTNRPADESYWRAYECPICIAYRGANVSANKPNRGAHFNAYRVTEFVTVR